KEDDLDLFLVPTGVLLMCVYHFYLLYRYNNKECVSTSIGYENDNKKAWVNELVKIKDAKDRAFAVSVISSQISALTSLTSISLVLCSLIGAILGKSTDSLITSRFIFEDTSESTNSIKYVAILFCFILAFACFVQTTRHLIHANFLISMPTLPTNEPTKNRNRKATYNPTKMPIKKRADHRECIQKAVLRGSNFWTAGLRALYLATTLILWIFGPIPMFVGSVATVMILYFLDIHNGEYLPFGESEKL
nr:reverse transcriptase domain, reverse transcriptase zinc-binding domain protein [Tanacetum cinerariifolium]